MKIYFLTLMIIRLVKTSEIPPAKRICLESKPSGASHIEASGTSSIEASGASHTESMHLDSLCDTCFSKINGRIGKAGTSSESNFQEIYQYLKVHNDNHRCYILAKKCSYAAAIDVLFESEQKTRFSTIYNLKFANENEMTAFEDLLRARLSSLDCHCDALIHDTLFLYRKVMGNVFRDNKFFVPSLEGVSGRRKHANYYNKYHVFADPAFGHKEVIKLLADARKNVRDIAAKNSDCSAKTSFDFYDSLIVKVSKLSNLTGNIVSKALDPFVYDEYKNKSSFRAVSFQPVHAFINYDAGEKEDRAKIKGALEAILLDKTLLETESIYSLLRMYRAHKRFSFSLFTEYTILVYHRIAIQDDALRNGREERVFLNLYYNLVLYLLPFYCKVPLKKNSLYCLERLSSNIPALSNAIYGAMKSHIAKKREDIAMHDLIAQLRDADKTKDFARIAAFFSDSRLMNVQAMSLLKTFSAQKLKINIKISILCELVKCGFLGGSSMNLNSGGTESMNLNSGDTESMNLNSGDIESICDNKSKDQSDDTDLIITYSLALVAYICRAMKARQEVKDGIVEAYLKLCADHPSIFTYSEGPHSAEYYVLHGYDILFNQCYFCSGDFKHTWMRCVLPDYKLSFCTSLWGNLGGISATPNPASADYDDLVEVKMLAFQMIRLYSQMRQNQGLMDTPVHSLLWSKLPFSEIYTYYFQSDPRGANYLITRCFLYCTEIRGQGLRIRTYYKYAAQNKASTLKYLKNCTISLLDTAKAGLLSPGASSNGELKMIFWNICNAVCKWGIAHTIGQDEELRKVVEKMILDISDALLMDMGAGDGKMPRELQILQALSSIFDYK